MKKAAYFGLKQAAWGVRNREIRRYFGEYRVGYR